MPIPDLDDLHRPVLEILQASDRPLTRQETLAQLLRRFPLTDEELRETVRSGQPRMANRAAWATTDLKKAGLINNPSRNQWVVLPAGHRYLAENPGPIRFATLQRIWQSQQEDPGDFEADNSAVAGLPPDEQIDQVYRQLRHELANEVLESAKAVSASMFERLVVKLLEKLGYGTGRETGRPGDQGIDGVLTQDKLGIEKVYVQAKRYGTTQVGEPEIRTFSGSLQREGATKGVLITTSTFSDSAKQTAQEISRGSQTIRLVDGLEVAKLMVEHNIGVVTKVTYEIKELDKNYFTEE